MDLLYDYEAALKKCGLTQSQVDKLRELANDCKTIPKSLTNKQVRTHTEVNPSNKQKCIQQLLLFLSANNGDMDKSISMMKLNYEIRRKAPQLFTYRDVKLPEMQQCYENQNYAIFPKTPDDNIVCFYGLDNTETKKFVYEPSTAGFIWMLGEMENY